MDRDNQELLQLRTRSVGEMKEARQEVRMKTKLLPPQGFRPEGEIPRRHSHVTRAYIKDSTYR